MTETITIDLRQLRLLLDKYYSNEELRVLCFDLDIDHGNLTGDNKSAKFVSLIKYLNNRSRIEELIDLVQKDRPTLQSKLDALSQPTAVLIDKSQTKIDHPTLRTLSHNLKRKRLLLFLGSDLPIEITGVPNRQMMADALARSEGIEPGQPLTAVSQQVMQSGNRFAFTQFLREQLDSTGLPPQPYHRTVTGLIQENGLELVVTTAYDNLLEQTFREAGIPFDMIINDTDLGFTMPGQPSLLKLFGDWQQPASLIVTQQDQNKLLNGRLQDKQVMLNQVKTALFTQTILFVGVDLHETAVSLLFDTVTGDQFQQPAYALWTGLSERETQAWQSNRNLTIIDVDPVTYLQTLLES